MNCFFYFLLLPFLVICYNVEQSQITVWLSSAAYCDKEIYPTMKIGGPANDFILTNTIYDKKTDILGFVGILHSSKTIYVVFRGSSSIMNWVDDFEIKKVKYTTYLPECLECKIHYGFYNSALSIKNETIDAVGNLNKLYPSYSVICTGHSLGAAIAQVISMELNRDEIRSIVYNFGQPRVGDINYSMFVNKKIREFWRFTHNRDMVVHTPPRKDLEYYHSCVEIFEEEDGQLKICSDSNCEDSNCADKYKLYQTNTKDHKVYLGHEMNCFYN